MTLVEKLQNVSRKLEALVDKEDLLKIHRDGDMINNWIDYFVELTDKIKMTDKHENKSFKNNKNKGDA